jgi:hypothetical protein
MPVLIFALVLVLIVGFVIYGIDLIPMDPRLRLAAKFLVIVIAVLLLVDRAGLV